MNYLAIKISENKIEEALVTINQKFTSFFPDNPNEYYLLEEYFNLQYKDDKTFANLFAFFSLLAIIITCLGLLGMVLFDSRMKTKEVGIRKVNGAGTLNISMMLLRENLKILILASVITIPLSQVLMHLWLSRFAYKTAVGLGFTIYPLLIVFTITIMTTLGHVIKTARANPVDSLKYE